MKDAITLYVEDANGTVYLAEQVGWLSTPDRRGGPFGIRKAYDDDEPIFRLVAEAARPELSPIEQAARELWAAAVLLFNEDDAQVMKAAGEVIGRWKPLVGADDAWEVVRDDG